MRTAHGFEPRFLVRAVHRVQQQPAVRERGEARVDMRVIADCRAERDTRIGRAAFAASGTGGLHHQRRRGRVVGQIDQSRPARQRIETELVPALAVGDDQAVIGVEFE